MKHKSERRGAKNLPGGNLIRKSTGRFGTPGILRVGSIIHAWTASTLTSLWSKKRPENGLSRKEMETLLTTAAHKVVNVAKCDAATNGAKWRVVPAVLELKIESPHGGVGKAMEALNFLFGGTLPLRTVNKRTQMVRGYISYQTGEPAEISLLRKEPKILRKFNFKKFFAALKTCGSEKAFLEKYCDVPAKLSARTPDEDEPVVDSLTVIKADILNLAERIKKLPPGDRTMAIDSLRDAREDCARLLTINNSDLNLSPVRKSHNEHFPSSILVSVGKHQNGKPRNNEAKK